MLQDNIPVYALIPARGGSKGIHRKNLALLCGKPLIEYTIRAALRSSYIDEVWVSSDDTEILSFADSYGVSALRRPLELASDNASAVPVVEHFISSLPASARVLDAVVVYLQPTSPLRNEIHIDQSLEQMISEGLSCTTSVVEADKSPYKAFMLDHQGCLMSLFDERLSNARRQDLPRCFFPNGAIYGFRISSFEMRKGFPSNGSLPYFMSSLDSIDIDNADDLARAQAVLGEQNG